VLCFFGGILGTGLAYVLSKSTEVLIRNLLPYSPTGSLIQLSPELILLTIVAVLLVGLLSGIYPSWRASRIRPLEAIRSE
jgi:putative ABC transport system permease protein